MNKVNIGTRGSKLALWQADYIAEKLRLCGLHPSISIIETKGDKVLDVAISKIGSKGIFTKELEDQLRQSTIDIAVHSAKDLPSSLPNDLNIIAFTEREKVNDVLLSLKKNIELSDTSLIIGTSSTRRIATLRHYFGNVKTVEIRGNLQTRIRKMEEGQCDALLLAYAGVYRMGYSNMIVKELSTEHFTPAVGQGSIAIEASTNLDSDLVEKIRAALNHVTTENLLLAERAYLKELEGGCSIPAFALAEMKDDQIFLKAGIFSLDGSKLIKKEVTIKAENAVAGGKALAEQVLQDGGKEILADIRKNIN
jgi:hydroxymethylbilane synthase